MIETIAIVLFITLLVMLFWYFANNKGTATEKKVNTTPEIEPVSPVMENAFTEEETVVAPVESESPPFVETLITEPSYQQNRKDRRRLRRNYYSSRGERLRQMREDTDDLKYI